MPFIPKDILFINGSVQTLNAARPYAEALLLRGERIVALGSQKELVALAAPKTEVVDLAGRCVLPGFHDSHVHLTQHGLELAQVRLEPAQSLDQGLEFVAERVAKEPLGWILGAGFLMSRWGVNDLTRQQLDAVAPENPVLLRSQDHHSAWVNSRALELAGVNAATPDPENGEIVRDAAGEPTGLLLERALHTVLDAVPPPSASDLDEALKIAAADFASLGVTTVHHMAYEPATYWQQIALQASAPDFPVRVWACLDHALIEQAAALGLATGQGGEHFQIGGAKFFADGALGSMTAWMLEPYEGTSNTGVVVDGPDVLRERYPKAIAAGLVPVCHAIGDAAIREVLNVLEETRHLWQAKHMRPRLEHAQHLHPDDIGRFGNLGVTASVQPLHLRFDAKRTGELLGERLATTHPWRSLKGGGALLAFGSDTPVASPGVIAGLISATERLSEEGEVVGLEQALTLEEALAAYTCDAAHAIGWEHRSGQLKPGFDADLVVLSGPPQEGLEDLSVDATMKAGRWTYRA